MSREDDGYYGVGTHNDFSSDDDDVDSEFPFKSSKRRSEISVAGDSTDTSDDDDLQELRKKTKSRIKAEENIYGIFQKEDNYLFDRKKKAEDPRKADPIHFVPSTMPTSDEQQGAEERKTSMEDANAVFHALLARGRGKTNNENSSIKDDSNNITDHAVKDAFPFQSFGSTASVANFNKPMAAAKIISSDRDFGKWEKHTKGIGAKLLAKMGYDGSGGLGSKRRKTEDSTTKTGVSRPVEVVVRPTNLGLGYGNFQEASTLKVNKQIEAELHGLKQTVDSGEDDNPLNSSDLFDETYTVQKTVKQNWAGKTSSKRLDTKKRKGQVAEAPATKIIDMRGPVAPPRLGQELLYNVNLLLQSIDAQVHACTDAVSNANSKLQAIDEDIKLMTNEIECISQKEERLKAIVTCISEIQERLQDICCSSSSDISNNINIRNVQQLISDFRAKFAVDYETLQLEQICIHLLSPWIENILAKTWQDPLHSPHQVALFVDQWRTILGGNENNIALSILISKHLLPKLQKTFCGRWDVVESSQSVLALYEACKTSFAVVANTGDADEEDIRQEIGDPTEIDKTLCDILNDTIAPKLHRAVVSSWKPHRRRKKESIEDVVPIHSWLLPWLAYLNDSTKTALLNEVFRKFRRAFLQISSDPHYKDDASWYSSNNEALQMLIPWKGVADDAMLESLIRESIAPQLALLLSTKLKINPSNQDLMPIHQVLSWYNAGLLRTSQLICLFDGLILLPWAIALHDWLASGTANMEEVAQFYLGWKSLIPKPALQDEVICRHLLCGLSMIDAALKKDTNALAALKPPLYDDRLAYYRHVVSRRLKEIQQQQQLQKEKECSEKASKGRYSSENIPEHFLEKISFREVAQEYAQKHDLLFQPKTIGANPVTNDGKQVFNFGVVPVYFDSDVAFAWQADSKSWEASSLEELVKMNVKL